MTMLSWLGEWLFATDKCPGPALKFRIILKPKAQNDVYRKGWKLIPYLTYIIC